MFITVTHCTTASKVRACRIICRLRQTSPKRWFANANMTSYYDVTNSVYPVTNDHHTLLLNTIIW